MELACRKETVKYWETVYQTMAEQEEQTEMIVPDICPDVGEILCSCPRVLLQRKQALDGRMEFSGLIRVSILYRPENENGVAMMEAAVPFALSPEAAPVSRQCILRAQPRVLASEVHLINSRKVLVKTVYQLEIQALEEQRQEIVSLVEDGEDYGIRQKTDVLRRCLTVSVQEKRFSCACDQTIPAAEPEATELLAVHADCACSEARILGDKVMIKGEAALRLLFRGEEGALFSREYRLPFSQIMEAGEDVEEGVCQVSLLITDLKCTLDPENRGSLQAKLTLEALSEVTRTVEVPVLADLYSTSYELEAEREPVAGPALLNQGETEETVRVALEGMEGDGFLSWLQVLPGRVAQRREEGEVILTQELRISALWVGPDGPRGIQRITEAVCRLPVPEGASCRFSVILPETPSAAEGEDEPGVSLPVRFCWSIRGQETREVIGRIALGERRDADREVPSLVIRAVLPDQTLWDLAKGYRSTEEDILAANGLTSEETYPGQILLIPRRTVEAG